MVALQRIKGTTFCSSILAASKTPASWSLLQKPWPWPHSVLLWHHLFLSSAKVSAKDGLSQCRRITCHCNSQWSYLKKVNIFLIIGYFLLLINFIWNNLFLGQLLYWNPDTKLWIVHCFWILTQFVLWRKQIWWFKTWTYFPS